MPLTCSDVLSDDEVNERLLAVHAEKNRLEGEIVALTGIFDRRQLCARDGARTTAGFLSARVDQTRPQCQRDVTLARRLESMPAVESAFLDGRLGRAKVDLLVDICRPEVASLFAEHEAMLVDEIAGLRNCDARQALRRWYELARLHLGTVDPDEPVVETAPRVAVDLAETFEGRFVLSGELDHENGVIVRDAIAAEVGKMLDAGIFGPDDGLSPAERRGQALVQIIMRKDPGSTLQDRPRPSVEVICDEKTLLGEPIESAEDMRSRICEYADGHQIPLTTLGRLLCGADIHRLVIAADGEVLNAGKTIRLANRAQRRALRFRHARHCAFPGCDAPTD